MRECLLIALFFLAASAEAAGLITPPGRDETLSFKARTHSPYDDSTTYLEPYLNGNSKAFPLAAEGKNPRNVDYDRICEMLGHNYAVDVTPQILKEEHELFWVESGAMFPKLHNQIIYFITCN